MLDLRYNINFKNCEL